MQEHVVKEGVLTQPSSLSAKEILHSIDFIGEINHFNSTLNGNPLESPLLDADEIGDLENNFLDQTWTSFVELCIFLQKYVAAIEIEGHPKNSKETQPCINPVGSGKLATQRSPKRVKLILKDDCLEDEDLLVSELVNILKKLVLREVFIGLSRKKLNDPLTSNPTLVITI